MDPERQQALLSRLRENFRPGSSLPGSAASSVVEVRESRSEAVLLFRWQRDPRLYGVPIALTLTDRAGGPHDMDDGDWLDTVAIELMESFDTGFHVRARRRRVADYIELRKEGGWPIDDRFYLRHGHPALTGLPLVMRNDGVDPSEALELRAHDKLLAWVVAYENNATGRPYVGQAVVAAAETGIAALVRIDTAPDVPDGIRLDLAYFAAQKAAAGGARRIWTGLPDEFLDLAGFRPAEGGRVLDTSFLDADPDGARTLHEADLATGVRWGRDRDLAGRHLPHSRAGRLLHLIRHGPSGRAAGCRTQVRFVADPGNVESDS